MTWLSSAEALTSSEVRSHTNMGFIIKEQKEALKRHQHLTKRSHSPNHTLGSVCPLVPSSLPSPNIPIHLKVPPASCQAATPWMLQVLFVSGNKQWVIYCVDSLISPWWFWKWQTSSGFQQVPQETNHDTKKDPCTYYTNSGFCSQAVGTMAIGCHAALVPTYRIICYQNCILSHGSSSPQIL